MRGMKQTFTYGNESLSITELLRKPEVVGYLKKDGPLTYASQRQKLRKLLRDGRINLQLVMEHAARNPTAPRVQDTRYGTQRRRAILPRKTTKGEVLFGPEPQPRAPRRPPSAIDVDGENLTARQVLERYPQLREILQQHRQISDKSLHAKVRTWIRKDKIPNHVFDPVPKIIPRERLLGNNVVGHHTIRSKGNTLPTDFLGSCDQVPPGGTPKQGSAEPDLYSGKGGFCYREGYGRGVSLRQQPVFGSTNLEEVYERMVAKMLEAFATYLTNGSGWILKRVVRLDIMFSRWASFHGCMTTNPHAFDCYMFLETVYNVLHEVYHQL